MSRSIGTRRGVAFQGGLFQVNLAKENTEDADVFAGELREYVRRGLCDGMESAGTENAVEFDYSDVFVMEFLLGAVAACQTASHEVSP